jgi:hypothetical protein
MRRKTYMLFTILIGTFLLLAGCTGKGLLHERMQNAANDITENMLMGMKEDDYAKFSSQFDQTMKKNLSESQFNILNADIKNKLGNYIAKEFSSSEEKDNYTIVIYKGTFSQEKSDVIIRTVLSESNGKIVVSGFWLDSPSLRK